MSAYVTSLSDFELLLLLLLCESTFVLFSHEHQNRYEADQQLTVLTHA